MIEEPAGSGLGGRWLGSMWMMGSGCGKDGKASAGCVDRDLVHRVQGDGLHVGRSLNRIAFDEDRRVFNLGIGYCAVMPAGTEGLVIGRVE